jgi:putative hemolysin
MILIVDSAEIVHGLVTINAILQAIIGELPYPSWFEEPGIIYRDDGSILMDGHLPIHKLKKSLKISRLPRGKKDTYINVAEFIVRHLDHIPISGESFTWEGYRFEVVDMDGPYVDKVLVRTLTDEDEKNG